MMTFGKIDLTVRPTWRYSWSTARSDLTAGATVAAIAVPQAMAYALIAGVDPRFGLYSAIVTTIVASLLGSSNHLINGPTNAISLVVFSALASFDGHLNLFEALFVLGIIVGVIQIAIAVFRLGDLTRFVSDSVILGFMAGAGLLIAIGQIGNFLGAPKKGTEDQSVLLRTWLTVEQGTFNPRAIALGIGTIVLVLLLHRAIVKWKLPRVDMLGGLVVASVVAAAFGWSSPGPTGKTIVSVVGAIPAALPGFHVPILDFADARKLLTGAIAIALLGLIEALAVAKSIATYTRQPLDYNRQCLAEGVGNVVGGFFQALPGSGSLTRSAINYQAGALTRTSGVFAGVIVAIVVLLLGPYARFIPKSALAGLLFITAARLIDWKRIAYSIRASRFDAILVLATAFTAIFIDVEDSILVGVVLSILLYVPRASRLGVKELVFTAERVVRTRRPGEPRATSLLIYDLEGELFFGTAPEIDRFLSDALDEARETGIRCIILRLRRTRNPDMVAVEHFERFLRGATASNVNVMLAGVRPDLARIFANIQLTSWFPEAHIFPDGDVAFSSTLRAIRYAKNLGAAESITVDDDAPEYYLV